MLAVRHANSRHGTARCDTFHHSISILTIIAWYRQDKRGQSLSKETGIKAIVREPGLGWRDSAKRFNIEERWRFFEAACGWRVALSLGDISAISRHHRSHCWILVYCEGLLKLVKEAVLKGQTGNAVKKGANGNHR
jgi:hypothetical protein